VGVWVASIEVVNGDPIELGPEVLLHPSHQVPHEGLQILHTGTVLGRDDEPELVAVFLLAREEVASVRVVPVLVVELTWLAIPSDAVPEDVVLMRTGGAKVRRSVPGDAGLHDDMRVPGRGGRSA
jgi:hypothetical protein